MTKKLASIFVATCATFVLIFSAVGIWIVTGGDKSDPTQANSLSDITLAMLPSEYTVVVNKTTSGEESYVLQKGRIYKFEAWGAMGGAGGNGGGAGGYGSYAVGWYDMLTNESVTASIFTGGVGSTGGTNSYGSPGWSATQYNEELQGTRGGKSGYASGAGGGGASGIIISSVQVIVAGGGGGGGGRGRNNMNSGTTFAGGGGGGENGANGNDGKGASQTGHGAGGTSKNYYGVNGSASGGGDGASGAGFSFFSGAGGGAGGGYKQGFAGGSGTIGIVNGTPTTYNGYGGGGGSGGTSYVGGVLSLSDSAANIEWAKSNGVGRVQITEYIMDNSVASPSSGTGYTVSAPSDKHVLIGGSYTFTVTRTSGTGDIGLELDSNLGTLELTSIDGNIFTYTVSNVQGVITAADFSTTSYNVVAPSNGTGYTISSLSSTSVMKGGIYSFVIKLDDGYAMPRVALETNGKVNFSRINVKNNTMTVTISNVQGAIIASDFSVSVAMV